MFGTSLEEQIINLLDLLAVQVLKQAGESFDQLEFVSVNCWGDTKNLELWKKVLGNKSLDRQDTIDIEPSTRKRHWKEKIMVPGKGEVDLKKVLVMQNIPLHTQIDRRCLPSENDKESLLPLMTDAWKGSSFFELKAKEQGFVPERISLTPK